MKKLDEWPANHYHNKMLHLTSLRPANHLGWICLWATLLLLSVSPRAAAVEESVTPPAMEESVTAPAVEESATAAPVEERVTPPAVAESATSPEGIPSEGVIAGFLDEYHTYLLDQIKGQTLWFDNFFGDRLTAEDDQPTSFVRLRTVARYTEGEGMTFPIRLRANLKLPRVNRRLRLVIFGGNREEDHLEELDDSIDSNLKSGEDKEWTNMGLRYMLFKSLRERFHFGGGLSVGWPLDYYVRMRYERLIHVGSKNIIRLSETGFWNSLNGFGETSRIDLERALGNRRSGRLSFFGTYSEDQTGLQWGAETSLYRQLSQHTALAIDLGAYGSSEPSMKVEIYRIGSRYRGNFLRPWLFYEIEPEVHFSRLDNGKIDTISILTTVLEIQFVT